jgi:succinoglycan biosynthesis transport protein ExoP
MTLVQFLRLVANHLRWMLLTGLIAAVATFWFTRHSQKEYQSYTILNTGLVSSYNIESSQGARIDYGYTNNEMENILSVARSRETQETLNARLLAQALLLDAPTPQVLSGPSFADLKKILPDELRQGVVVPGNLDQTLANIIACRDRIDPNPVKKLLESDHPLFGIEHLQTITIKRENNSDMIRIAYSTTDPAVCRNTIAGLTELFIAKHKRIKEGQSNSVLEFFEMSTKESAQALSGKEDDMLGFMVGNKIINYYEQTRFIAAKKEDLDELYYQELMSLAAADSSRRNLEGKLGGRVNLPEINRNLLAQREMLSGVSAQITNLQIGSLTDSLPLPGDAQKVLELQKQESKLREGMRRSAEAVFAVNRTPDGIDTKNMLTHWLDQWLEVEQTLARLGVLRDRKTEFDRIYSRFAPWGSKMKRLEREIDVAERAYLENLHSYNQARLHKYNTEMANTLRVVDAPFFPDKPLASKRAMLVILAGFIGMILILAMAIAKELIDNTMRDPERAAHSTGLELAAAFSLLPVGWQTNRKMDYPFLVRRAAEQMMQRIQLDLRKQGAINHPPRIAVLSTREGEGKSQVIELVRTLPAAAQMEWIEMPALLAGAYPVDELAQADVALLVVSATRTWNVADTRALAMIDELIGRPCRLVLNKVAPDRLETAMGELPKKRSTLRRWVKKMATLNLSKS